MSYRPSKLTLFVSALLLLAPLSSFGQEQPPERPDNAPPEIAKTAPDIYKLGTVLVNARERTLTMPGNVNMRKGLVELLACTQKGKRHESVLVVTADPLYLQLALLLLGLVPGRNPSCPGENDEPTGAMADIFVEWQSDDGQKVVRKRAEELILDLRGNKPMQRTPWVFLGSRVYKGTFLAREIGSLVTTYHDSTAILENPLPSCNDDTLYEANPDVVPPVGTPVTVIVSPAAKEGNDR